MKSKRFLKAISYLLTLTLLLSIMQLDVFAMDYDSSQASVTDPLSYSLPDPEKQPEYQILGEQEEKRDATTKYFMTEHGNGIAAVYNEPVHYQTEDGSWEEIDNSLAEANDIQVGEVYENTANDVKVKLAKKRDHKRLVTLDDGEYQLSWGFENAQKSGGNQNIIVPEPVETISEEPEETPVTQEEIHAYNQKKMGVSRNQSEALYEDVYPNIDAQYIITGKTVKENIILNDKSAASQAISFHIRHNRMHIRAEEDGSLSLVENAEPQDVIYTLAAPYMVDANGKISRDVRFEVEPGKNIHESVVKVVADQAWLTASDRAYPVVIDPLAETSRAEQSIFDTYVNSSTPNTSNSAMGSFLVGKGHLDGLCHALIKFVNLPELDQGALIYDAYLSVWQYQYSADDNQGVNISAVEILGDWNQNVTWNSHPPYDVNTALDYEFIDQVETSTSTTYTEHVFNITKQVRKWYNEPGGNKGIMLRSMDEVDRFAVGRFFASNYPFNDPHSRPQVSEALFPSGIFRYRNTWGLESYWSYHSQSAGRSGTGSINDFNGNLIFAHGDTATSGSRLPVSVSHVYNSSDRSNDWKFGCGWRLNVTQRMEESGLPAVNGKEFPYVYTDEDGTKHYFYKDGDIYKDEDGLGLELQVIEPGPQTDYIEFILTAKDKSVMRFDDWGALRQYRDPNDDNRVNYNYAPDYEHPGDNYLMNIADGAGHMLSFEYSNYRLTKITDEAGRAYQYSYDGSGNLTSITYPDGEVTQFQYDSDHKLTKVIGIDGYTLEYTYSNDMGVARVTQVRETNGNDVGQTVRMSYDNGLVTRFTDGGPDGNIDTPADNRTYTYHFDNLGRCTDVHDQDGNANTYQYFTASANTDSDADMQKHNSLLGSGSTQKNILNFVDNPGFENVGDNWIAQKMNADPNYEFGVVRTYDKGYLGNTSISVSKGTADSSCGVAQDITLPTTGKYTLSAYVNTENVVDTGYGGAGATLIVVPVDSAGNWIGSLQFSEFVTGTSDPSIENGWQRIYVTFDATAGTTYRIYGAICNTTGIAWFDCFQLEEGEVPNKFNLVNNPSFERVDGSTIRNWETGEFGANDGSVSDHWNGEKGVKMTGELGKRKYIRTGINVSGKEGDVFSLSGWAKGNSIPGREFNISAAIIYDSADASGSTVRWITHDFNPYVSDWQFGSVIVNTADDDPTTTRNYLRIDLYIFYGDNLNTAWFDDVQLIKDNGQSYVYDDEGNVVSAADAATATGFTYNDDRLAKLTDPTGTSFEYSYDFNKKSNLLSARNSEGVKTLLKYDQYGNPVGATIQHDITSTAVTDGRVYYIRNKGSGKYLDVTGSHGSGGTLIQQAWYDGGTQQRWKAIDVGGGYFKFKPMHYAPGMVMDLRTGSSTNGLRIQIYIDNGGDGQKFKVRPLSDGSYQIEPKCGDGKVVTNYGGGTAGGENPSLWPINGEHVDQSWYFEPADTGASRSAEPQDGKTYYIRARHSGQVLDVPNGTEANGTGIIQCYLNDGKNQRFRLEAVPGEAGYFYLVTGYNDNKVLGIASDGVWVNLQDQADADSQKFRFEKNDATGAYRIHVKSSNAVLDVTEISYARDTPINVTPVNGQANQEWILDEISRQLRSSAEYNSDGSLVTKVTDTRGNSTAYAYEGNPGLVTKATDAKGNATTYTYDPNTDAVKSVTAGGVTNSYTYEDDRIKTITHNGFDYSFLYDSFGNTTATKVGSQTLLSNTYGPFNGLLQSSAYGNGKTVGYTYDRYDRLTEKSYDGSAAFRYKYDARGALFEHEDLLNGVTTRYDYDLINRLTGMRTSRGQELQVRYDDKNRVDFNLSKVLGVTTKTQYVYGDTSLKQKPGLIYGVKIDDSQVLSYGYDDLSRLSTRTLNTTTPFVTRYEYLDGALPNSTTTLVKSVQVGNDTYAYTYDEVGNITEIKKNGTRINRYEYDALGQLTLAFDYVTLWGEGYAYDTGGNLRRKDYYDLIMGNETQVVEQVIYSYDDPNWKDKLTSYDGQDITYDEIGNPLTYRDGISFTWQHGRELARFTKTGTTASYSYDDSGIRTKKVVNGVTTEYYLNGSTILTQITGNDRLDFLYDDAGSLLGLKWNGTAYYYVKNLQGDIIGILDSDGSQVVEYTYNAWGGDMSVTGTMRQTLGKLNPFRYRGYYYDTESRLYYLNSRYYDPEIGRFLNADGLIYAKEALPTNLYKYCDNNPINNIDLDGYNTYGLFYNGRLSFSAGVVYSCGVYWDDDFNFRFVMSPGLNCAGTVDLSGGVGFQMTYLDEVTDLYGEWYNIGGSVTVLGGDAVMTGDAAVIGWQVGLSASPLPANIHFDGGKSTDLLIYEYLYISFSAQIGHEIGLEKYEVEQLIAAARIDKDRSYEAIREQATYLFPVKAMR